MFRRRKTLKGSLSRVEIQSMSWLQENRTKLRLHTINFIQTKRRVSRAAATPHFASVTESDSRGLNLSPSRCDFGRTNGVIGDTVVTVVGCQRLHLFVCVNLGQRCLQQQSDLLGKKYGLHNELCLCSWSGPTVQRQVSVSVWIWTATPTESLSSLSPSLCSVKASLPKDSGWDKLRLAATCSVPVCSVLEPVH